MRPLRDPIGRDPILPDYSNVRGVNFLPVFAHLFDDPPDLPPHLEFRGTASPVAIWRFWDTAVVDEQLALLPQLGLNTVRMWTSYAVWKHEERHRGRGENAFLERWVGFLDLCAKHHLWVIPVLWDELIGEPSDVPYDDIADWRKSPGTARTTVAWATDPTNPFRGDRFVRAVVEASRNHPSILLWDVMNEPRPHVEFHRHYCDRIREWDPDPQHAITIGFAAQVEWATTQLWDHPTLDVLSFHPYGMFRQNVEEWARMARKVARPPFADRPKPVIVTEGGAPLEVTPYVKHIDYCRQLDLGFLPFLAIIGDPRGNMPFKEGGGVFYHDGEVRHDSEARAFQARAVEQGRIPGLLPAPVEKVDLRGFEPSFFPEGYGVEELLADLDPRRWPARPRLRDENFRTDGYVFQRQQLTSLDKDLLMLSDVAGTPRGFLDPDDQATLAELREEFARRDLLAGTLPDPWVTGSPVRIDWKRYHDFFTAWGITMWEVVRRAGLGG